MDGKAAKDTSLVERWVEDQREWQKTARAYLDSMVKNDDFLVHLGNAMRGSLLAGKPYPSTPVAAAPPAAPEAPPDDRLDRVLFAIHEMQGQITDLRLTLDELRGGIAGSPPKARPAPVKASTARATARSKAKSKKSTHAGKSARSGKSPGRARG